MIWYTADLHLGHNKVSQLREFNTTDQHDGHIAYQWRRQVSPQDIVYVLGDLSMGNPQYALDLVETLPGRKRLIAGNHDACHPMHRNYYNWVPRYMEVFESVAPFGRRRVKGTNVLLSHFPYTADHGTARHMQWRLPNYGQLLMHGHTHSKNDITSGLELHVGWDAWDCLVSNETVEVWVDDHAGSVVGSLA